MDVRVERMPSLRVGAVRHTGPYLQINHAFERLGDIVDRAGVEKNADMAMLAIFHDDPESTPPAELRADAGLTFAADARLPKELEERWIPAGRYAHTTHIGPYEELGNAWARLKGEWLPSSGERLRDAPSFEIYRNTPETAEPRELRTELYIPVE
jgi:AraC family transcriptional regulator